MATLISTAVYTCADVTSWRSWTNDIHNGLLSTGLVAASDTGQYDLAAGAVAAVNTFAGYRIYRFNDALAGVAPCYVKIEYGQGGAATPTCPRIRVTVGVATDGAGTITATSKPITASLTSATNNGNTSISSYYSGGNGYIATLIAPGITSSLQSMFHLVIDRLRAPDGSPTTDGFYVQMGSAGTSNFWVLPTYPSAPTSLWGEYGAPCVMGWQYTNSAVQGTDVGVYPHTPSAPKPYHASVAVVGVYRGDFPNLTTFSASFYGQTMTFLAAGSLVSGAGRAISNAASGQTIAPSNSAQFSGLHSLAIRWD